MTEIILARHGETEWNLKEVFRGRANIELNETGRKQAELLADYLSGVEIEAVYSSPLKRAMDTARAIANRQKLNIEIAPGLTDLDFGEWQGVSHDEVREKYPDLYHEWVAHPQRVRIPGGESLADVRQRAMEVVKNTISCHTGTVVLVSHRVVSKVLICALLGLDDSHFWNVRLDTAAITRFSHENGQFILTEHNNTSYLSEECKARLRDF